MVEKLKFIFYKYHTKFFQKNAVLIIIKVYLRKIGFKEVHVFGIAMYCLFSNLYVNIVIFIVFFK